MAWALARQHNGDVRHVSVPGGPTRFVLTLPLNPSASGEETGPATAAAVSLPAVAAGAEHHLGASPC
jgi:hypothetical protein